MRAVDLVELLRPVASPDGVEWLEGATKDAREENRVTPLLTAFVGASRRLGKQPLVGARGAPVPLDEWTADIAGRAALLLVAAELDPETLSQTVQSAYDVGDAREKAAIVRALPLLPDPGRFVDLCLDAGRTNDTNLFGALAIANPYPADHYPELEFNKLVMKAAFVDIPLHRIAGLDARANPELARMGMDYVSERQAAGRPFAPELWRVVGPHPPAGAVARMVGELFHADVSRRREAALGLELAKSRDARPFLLERLELESDPEARRAITLAVEATDPRRES